MPNYIFKGPMFISPSNRVRALNEVPVARGVVNEADFAYRRRMLAAGRRPGKSLWSMGVPACWESEENKEDA